MSVEFTQFILFRNASEAPVTDLGGNQVSVRSTPGFVGDPIAYSAPLDAVAYFESDSGQQYLRLVFSDDSVFDYTNIPTVDYSVNSILFSQDGKYVAFKLYSYPDLMVFLVDGGTPVDIDDVGAGALGQRSVAFFGDFLFYPSGAFLKRANLLTGDVDNFHESGGGAGSIVQHSNPGGACLYCCLEYNPSSPDYDYVLYSFDGTTLTEIFRFDVVEVPITEMAMAFDGANVLIVGSFYNSLNMYSYWEGELYNRAYSPMMNPFYSCPAKEGWIYNNNGRFGLYSGDLIDFDEFSNFNNLNGAIYPFSFEPPSGFNFLALPAGRLQVANYLRYI